MTKNVTINNPIYVPIDDNDFETMKYYEEHGIPVRRFAPHGTYHYYATLEKKLAHNGHPVLRWNVDNIFIRQDPTGNIKADKAKSTEKIDGAIATIMALDRAIRCGIDTSESVYDTRGLLVF